MWGVAWLPILWVALLLALLQAAASPVPADRRRVDPRLRTGSGMDELRGDVVTQPEGSATTAVATAVGVFLWLALFVFGLAIVVGYAI